MKKLMLFLSLFAFMLGGCKGKDISRPNYIEFAEQQIAEKYSREIKYYSIVETNDENYVAIYIYCIDTVSPKYNEIDAIYLYNVVEDTWYVIR